MGGNASPRRPVRATGTRSGQKFVCAWVTISPEWLGRTFGTGSKGQPGRLVRSVFLEAGGTRSCDLHPNRQVDPIPGSTDGMEAPAADRTRRVRASAATHYMIEELAVLSDLVRDLLQNRRADEMAGR